MKLSKVFDFEIDGQSYRLQKDQISYKETESKSLLPFSLKPRLTLLKKKLTKKGESYWEPMKTDIRQESIPLKQIIRCWIP